MMSVVYVMVVVLLMVNVTVMVMLTLAVDVVKQLLQAVIMYVDQR